MARSGDVEKGEASRKRLGLPESGVKYGRAKKKARPTENVSKVSRKRAWDEVTQTESLNDDRSPTSHSPSPKILRVGSMKKSGDEGDTQDSVSEKGDVHGLDLSQRKWKRTPKIANSEPNSGPSGSCLREAPGASEENLGTRSAKEGKQKQIIENEVVRKVLQTVHLEESRTKHEHEESIIGLENESADIVSSLEQTALNGRDRKRREPDKGEGSLPRQPKKLRIDDAGAEASHRTGVTLGYTNTWKRLKRDNTGNSAAAASEDMRVSISEAWKRLRDEKDTETSGSSVNGRSDSDLSMHSVPEWIEERSKKARYENLPIGRKWKRQNREKKQSSSGKRQRDGNGCESSGSSGSDMAQSSYLHNRKWKRPRYENLMYVQGRLLRRQQARDGEEARERCRRRIKGDASKKKQSK